jgi:predicted  nucleic acid-binding Zn-ribbon protein
VTNARSEAEQIVGASRTEAADQLQRAQEEIANLRNEAQEWLHELRADTERVWSERRKLVDDLRALAAHLQEAVSDIRARSQDPSSARDSRHTRG